MKIEVGNRYRHYKMENEYTVLCVARLESNPDTLCVVYRAEYETDFGKETVWIRPVEDFEATVELPDGTCVHRFTKIE